MMDVWYFHSVLVVGPLKDCIEAAALAKTLLHSRKDILLTTQPTKRITTTTTSTPIPPFPPYRKLSEPLTSSQGVESLKERASRYVAKNWGMIFPAGEEGKANMKRVPTVLWEGILPHIPLYIPPPTTTTPSQSDDIIPQEEEEEKGRKKPIGFMASLRKVTSMLLVPKKEEMLKKEEKGESETDNTATATDATSITLREAIESLKNNLGEESGIDYSSIVLEAIHGILLIELQDSGESHSSDYISKLRETLSKDTVIIYNRCNDWGAWLDFLEISKGGNILVGKTISDRRNEFSDEVTDQYIGEVGGDGLTVVDSYLPEDLWNLRNLLRPHREFTFYSDKHDNLPRGFHWLPMERFINEAPTPGEQEISLLSNLLKKQ